MRSAACRCEGCYGMETIRDIKGVRLPVLTPNLKGFQAAVATGAKEVAVFASETSIAVLRRVVTRYRDVALAAKKLSIPVRGFSGGKKKRQTKRTLDFHLWVTLSSFSSFLAASMPFSRIVFEVRVKFSNLAFQSFFFFFSKENVSTIQNGNRILCPYD